MKNPKVKFERQLLKIVAFMSFSLRGLTTRQDIFESVLGSAVMQSWISSHKTVNTGNHYLSLLSWCECDWCESWILSCFLFRNVFSSLPNDSPASSDRPHNDRHLSQSKLLSINYLWRIWNTSKRLSPTQRNEWCSSGWTIGIQFTS